MSATHSCAFTGLGKWRVSAPVTRKNLLCISARAQKDKFDELLGHSRLFLMLNMHPNTAFWQPNRAAGANTRWGGGTKCYRKYGCAAQSTTWTEAFWQMNDDVPERFRVIQPAAPDVMPRDVSPAQRTHLKTRRRAPPPSAENSGGSKGRWWGRRQSKGTVRRCVGPIGTMPTSHWTFIGRFGLTQLILSLPPWWELTL